MDSPKRLVILAAATCLVLFALSSDLVGQYVPAIQFALESPTHFWDGDIRNAATANRPWQPGNHKFRPHSAAINLHLFAAMSTYRSGRNSFTVIGEASTAAMRMLGPPADACVWESLNAKAPRVETKARVLLPGDTHDRLYETSVVVCEFPGDIGADGLGGRLSLRKEGEGAEGEGEELLVHQEPRGAVGLLEREPLYEVAFCGPPVYGEIRAKAVRDWFEYHDSVLGASAHFFLYDSGGVTWDVASVLQPYVEAGKLTLTRVEEESLYDAWSHHQLTKLNDCLYRTRYTARWTLFFDLDEYLYIPPETTLQEVLNGLLGHHPWASLGKVAWDVAHCTPEDVPNGESWLERLLWRDPDPECAYEQNISKRNLCLNIRGRRKYVIDPMRTSMLGIHAPMLPLEGSLDWNASIHSSDPKLYHFHGLLSGSFCNATVNASSLGEQGLNDGKLVYDTTMAEKARTIRLKNIPSPPPSKVTPKNPLGAIYPILGGR